MPGTGGRGRKEEQRGTAAAPGVSACWHGGPGGPPPCQGLSGEITRRMFAEDPVLRAER